jgi:hypothetical protein
MAEVWDNRVHIYARWTIGIIQQPGRALEDPGVLAFGPFGPKRATCVVT